MALLRSVPRCFTGCVRPRSASYIATLYVEIFQQQLSWYDQVPGQPVLDLLVQENCQKPADMQAAVLTTSIVKGRFNTQPGRRYVIGLPMLLSPNDLAVVGTKMRSKPCPGDGGLIFGRIRGIAGRPKTHGSAGSYM